MANDDRIKVLEDEFKLIKSELKQTLSSVRDFLLDLKLPPTPMDARSLPKDIQMPGAGNQGGGPSSASASAGSGSGGSPAAAQPPVMEVPPKPAVEPEPVAEAIEPEQEPVDSGMENEIPLEEAEDELVSEQETEEPEEDETGMSSGDMPGEEGFTGGFGVKQEARAATPQVNLLSNLVRWVATARKEITAAQLPAFLDIYATTGNLKDEMKTLILKLSEVTAEGEPELRTDKIARLNEELAICLEINGNSARLPADVKTKIQRLMELILKQSACLNKADSWSQLMLELHGILAGAAGAWEPLATDALSLLDQKAQEADESRNDLDEPGVEEDLMPGVPDSGYGNGFSSRSMKGQPARLRLIMPVGDGSEQELELGNLFIATDNAVHSTGTRNAGVKNTEAKAKSFDPKAKKFDTRTRKVITRTSIKQKR
jgi:hypothetical protein